MWCIGQITPEFIWHMEDVLHQHELPYDPRRPIINLDERPCQLIGDVVQPIPMESGKVKREDSEYERNGVCNLFTALEPLAGNRVCTVFQHRTGREYAMFMKMLSELHYPDVEKIVIIQDNLSTHNPGSFYKLFSPEEAFKLDSRFELHYTPKKASWLNMAEIELSVISKQCLDRRIATQEQLKNEVYALVEERNKIKARVNWSFSKTKARQKLERHYSTITN
ncbi:MAG TPA: IS630 family transposase [Syntrophobacteraceae bacterium]|nr:IS630 family transposase [Syntrophobacteraceae bacterium]